ncbi:MAG TPA: VOC family protein [Caulobacteraceae bacterium]|nr:VOC family protein [Caulobacteraceae bacterium]
MIVGLDHIGLAIADPEAATRAYEALMGATAAPGAPRRLQLANMALEISEGAAAPVFSLGFAVDDLAETARVLERRGIASQDARLSAGATHGVAIALASRRPEPPPPGRPDAPHALDHVVIHTPDPERAVALYGGRLGLDLRLDRANPQWGSRLLFFRCGGAVVEVGADLKAPVSDGPDRITGLAWRVADPAAARARLDAAGLDVSPVRPGRKPGTTVFTVRSGVPGAPALMLGGNDP